MKVAVVVGGFPVTSETFITNHVVGLMQAGHKVRVYMRRPNWKTPALASFRGIDLLSIRRRAVLTGSANSLGRVISLLAATIRAFLVAPRRAIWLIAYCIDARSARRGSNPLAVWRRLVPFLERWTPDVLHCHFGTNGLLGAELVDSKVIRAPLVVSFHGYDVHAVPRKKGPEVYAPLFNSATIITANTNFTASKLRELGCPSLNIRVVPMGFFTDTFEFGRDSLERYKGTFRALTVARLVEKKGIEYALEAVAILGQRGLDIRYDIVGDGDLRGRLEARAKELGILDYVRFWGRQTAEEVASHMRAANLFLLPSVTASNGDMEGQALVLQEAQACGLPVVSTRHNGIPEGVHEDVTGVLVPERNSHALARVIEDLAGQPERLAEMSRAAVDFVRSKYDQRELTREWERIYRETVR